MHIKHGAVPVKIKRHNYNLQKTNIYFKENLQISENFRIFAAKIIIMRRLEVISQVKELGSRVIPKGSHLLLYGSRARGDNRTDSDWDMLVLLNRPHHEDEDFRQISYPLMELGFDLGQYFSIHTYSQQEWQNMSFLPFYKNVEQDKIVLV